MEKSSKSYIDTKTGKFITEETAKQLDPNRVHECSVDESDADFFGSDTSTK